MVGQVRSGVVNQLAPKGPFEENLKVGKAVADLAKRTHEGGASSIMFLPQKGVKFEAFAFAYHTGLAKELNINAAPAGPLRGTVVINASGHASGGINDRVTGWAEREFSKLGFKVDGDVKRFQTLAAACAKAGAELSSDFQRTKPSVTIEVDGKKVELHRDMFDKMQKASLDSDDPELARLAELGNEALRTNFAATNTYNVRIRTPDGKVTETRGIPRNNPERIEFATRIQIEIPESKGEIVLEAWPTGSAEVAGYVEARRYRIHVGADLFSMDGAIAAAEKYQQAHPEVRWDTDHEDADLEKTHVAPSPYPYQDF